MFHVEHNIKGMCVLRKIEIQNIRNLSSLTLESCGKYTHLIGPNGSGKTSILEAIHLLSTGRSFRTNKIQSVLQLQAEELLVRAQWQASGEGVLSIGSQKFRNKSSRLRLDGKDVAQQDLARLMPVQVLNPDSFRLLMGEPEKRRHLIDWGLFHVEHHFWPVWQKYYHVLKQRNKVLQERRYNELAAWNPAFIEAGQALARYREEYVRSLMPYLTSLLEKHMKMSISVSYSPGYHADQSFEGALLQASNAERERGFTTIGPHRADLSIKVENAPAREILSRGQAKLFVFLLLLSQNQHLVESINKDSILLIDDLSSEMDVNARSQIYTLLEGTSSQVFLTSIDEILHSELKNMGCDGELFHVEQCIDKKNNNPITVPRGTIPA